MHRHRFLLNHDGIHLQVMMVFPTTGAAPYPSVQIHHGGGGYDTVYTHLTENLAQQGFIGISMIHRGYPGSEGRQGYGRYEISDIGHLVQEIITEPRLDKHRMGIMGYSRGAYNAILAIERYNYFRAGALWSTPVDMLDHVKVNPWIVNIIGCSPEECPQTYHELSAIHSVDQINCPLLLIHGVADEVIPVRHCHRLADALKKCGKPYEEKYHLHEGHTWSSRAFFENWQLTLDFFKRFLNPENCLKKRQAIL